jgi:hypothetical protein
VLSGENIPDLTRYNHGRSVEDVLDVVWSMVRVIMAVKSIERGIGKGACERPLEPAKGEEGS